MGENLGFLLFQTVLGALGLLFISRTATTGLLAYALAAAVFGGLSMREFRRTLHTLPDEGAAPIGRLIYTYGVPLGILTTCQWFQMSAERYVLGIQLDFETVGRYVAAYQVCGFPFMMMNTVLTTLAQPIAFQRARDVSDPGQLWAADRLLLAGLGLFIAVGIAIVGGYAFYGPLLLRLLASKDYVLPAGTLTLLAAARMLMFGSLVQHMFFKVHQQTRFLLLYSVIGGAVAIAASWLLVSAYGVGDAAIFGAALGVLITGVIYNLLLAFAPGGVWPLLRRIRAHAAPLPAPATVSSANVPEVGP